MMNNRRDFLKKTGIASLAMLGGLSTLSSYTAKPRPLGLQLFTFFPSFDEDVRGNLTKVKAIGYEELESAFSMKGGFYGMKPKEFSMMTTDLGLSWRAHHVLGAPLKPIPGFDTSGFAKMANLKNNTQQIIDEAAEGNIKYLVCASIPIDTLDEVKEATGILSNAGELANKAGLTLCYHNHDAEFKEVEGQIPYDIFLSQISSDLMKFELDLAWATKAGVSPVELFKKHKKRFPLLHVKDIDASFENVLPVGEGVVDFESVFDNLKMAGVEYLFVEHDMPKDAFASIESSYKYLRKRL